MRPATLPEIERALASSEAMADELEERHVQATAIALRAHGKIRRLRADRPRVLVEGSPADLRALDERIVAERDVLARATAAAETFGRRHAAARADRALAIIGARKMGRKAPPEPGRAGTGDAQVDRVLRFLGLRRK